MYEKYILIFVIIVLIIVNQVRAEEFEGYADKISIGGYTLARYESAMSLTEPDFGSGLSVSPEDTLGLTTEQTVVRLDGVHRFNKSHALVYSWYAISSNGNKILDEEMDWLDEDGNQITIPAGAQVESVIDYDIYKLGYFWSFYHSDKVELSAGAGAHITRVGVRLNSDTTSSGVEARHVSTNFPLPVLSFAMKYHVTAKLFWYLKTEAFALSFDNWEGTYTDSTAGLEYHVLDNIGLGAGLGSNALKLTEKDSEYKFTFDNRISGAVFYVAVYF